MLRGVGFEVTEGDCVDHANAGTGFGEGNTLENIAYRLRVAGVGVRGSGDAQDLVKRSGVRCPMSGVRCPMSTFHHVVRPECASNTDRGPPGRRVAARMTFVVERPCG